ncbi:MULTISPECIES: hypothetical protein [Stenotrophomonas]|nr:MULTISPECIES: hypothetical protein [Stenotrophomonas]EVT73859.1 hypothetical protein X548_00680 [Stenotrophomonas maltophilia 5BA-I-2]MDR6695405.1 hypothetical protein [Stenotrophomonas sp. 1337]QBR42965.1 hypothetical protein DAIF1_04920 [Stenotrophomonas indicatrix]
MTPPLLPGLERPAQGRVQGRLAVVHDDVASTPAWIGRRLLSRS